MVWAIRSMSRGIASQYIDPGENSRPRGMWTTQVRRPTHPEMLDVKPGDQLMGVTFERKTECDLEEYRALQERIEELKSELEDPWDDDDDDGDVAAIIKR